MKLYRAEHFHNFDDTGIRFHIATAEDVEVGGVTLVKRGVALYLPEERQRWHDTQADAFDQAAAMAETLAAALLVQAATYRGKAQESREAAS
jgi:hypothetical protein